MAESRVKGTTMLAGAPVRHEEARRWLVAAGAVVMGVALLATPATGQTDQDPLAGVRRTLPASPDSARTVLTGLLHETIARVEQDELSVLANGDAGVVADDGDPGSDSGREEERQLLVALLDTLVLETTWGGEELERLRRRYPSSALFLRYEARLAQREERFADAVSAYDRLLSMRPTDADLQLNRGRALEGLERPHQAVAAYTRAFEAAPERDAAFRALVRLRKANGTLPDLLEQVERLRALYPDVADLDEKATEVRHRLRESRSRPESS